MNKRLTATGAGVLVKNGMVEEVGDGAVM
jgi:hypothetical protein